MSLLKSLEKHGITWPMDFILINLIVHTPEKQGAQRSTSSPNCSYLTASLPLPHHKVPGSIQARFLRGFASPPSLANLDALVSTRAQGPSEVNNALMLNLRVTVCPWLSLHRARYLSVTGGLEFTSHVTSRMSSDHTARYKECAPSGSSRRKVTRVCPSMTGLQLKQE